MPPDRTEKHTPVRFEGFGRTQVAQVVDFAVGAAVEVAAGAAELAVDAAELAVAVAGSCG